MPFVVREIQPTPNPNAAKFVLDRPIVQERVSFFTADAAKEHPVASQLFSVPGVTSVLLFGDFLTINKAPDAKWGNITERVRSILRTV